jgi:hypothetical protein
MAQGDGLEALASYHKSLAISEPLAARDPGQLRLAARPPGAGMPGRYKLLHIYLGGLESKTIINARRLMAKAAMATNGIEKWLLSLAPRVRRTEIDRR